MAFFRLCAGEGADEAMVGAYTLREVREDPAKLERARAGVDASEEVWERVGRFLLSREREAFGAEDDRVIIGVALSIDSRGATHFVFANTRYEIVRLGGEQFRAIVDADRAARAEMQLAPPPDWESLVREFLESHPRVWRAKRVE